MTPEAKKQLEESRKKFIENSPAWNLGMAFTEGFEAAWDLAVKTERERIINHLKYSGGAIVSSHVFHFILNPPAEAK